MRSQIQLWAEPERLERLGGKPRVGSIFSGPPGTGKTTSAHAFASETGRDLYTFSGPEFPASVVEARLDDAATEILMDGEAHARALLGANRSSLELLADKLCEHHYADSSMLRGWLEESLPGIV